MNLFLSLPSEISEGAAPVQREVLAYLAERDLSIERLGLGPGRTALRRAAAEARRRGTPDAAREIFVQALAQERSFDVVVMPSLLLHGVQVTDSSGTWNGVRRRLAMLNAPVRATGRADDTFAEGVAAGGISGDVMATSLHVMVFSAQGERVFEGMGGLDFIHDIDLAPARQSYHYDLRRKVRLLGDPKLVREGVEIAFGPYLPPPPEG
jgi:hypothetical protein